MLSEFKLKVEAIHELGHPGEVGREMKITVMASLPAKWNMNIDACQ